MTGLFFFAIWQVFFRANPPNVQHCTWLGFPPRAASGGSRARAETPGRGVLDSGQTLYFQHLKG